MYDEKYMPAEAKAVALADWSRFIKGGFRKFDFTEALYKHLTLNCSFIAHTNRSGFYNDFFAGNAAALAVFMNQFGGSKVAAETLWVEWRSGTAHDLKEAMCAEATEFFPIFERVLTQYALEKYEEEKWQDAREMVAQLPAHMQSAESMSHMGLIFELIFPLETYLNYLPVDDELRDRLTVGREIIFDPPDAPFPAAEVPAWNLNGRAEEIEAAHHLSLFEQQEETTTLPPIDAGANNLARQIAALSRINTETQSVAPPLVIEGEKQWAMGNGQ